MIQLLLDHRANVDMTDKEGRTALMYAAMGEGNESYVDAIPLLLAKGADPNKRDKRGRTPLDIARTNENRNRFVIEALEAIPKKR